MDSARTLSADAAPPTSAATDSSTAWLDALLTTAHQLKAPDHLPSAGHLFDVVKRLLQTVKNLKHPHEAKNICYAIVETAAVVQVTKAGMPDTRRLLSGFEQILGQIENVFGKLPSKQPSLKQRARNLFDICDNLSRQCDATSIQMLLQGGIGGSGGTGHFGGSGGDGQGPTLHLTAMHATIYASEGISNC
uniref:Uncharacterized protein n=1 Tax=Mycena chlorophos TaxID=658473 RepID=A0ABQ0LXY5_MYCCL|nr:predicted protein [Mycena chlorophos]